MRTRPSFAIGAADGFAAAKPNTLAAAPDDDPISVMLDFVHPISAGRRRRTLDRLGGHDEPGRQLAAQHGA
jgi:hypothetical protein